MGLSLVVGPAHVGKVALLLERYLDVLERDPWLVVPNRVDVDRVERDLIRRRPALLAGTIGTFDDLFRHVAEVRTARFLSRPRPSARSPFGARSRVASSTVCASLPAPPGSPTRCSQAIGELEAGLVDLDGLDGELAALVERVSRGAWTCSASAIATACAATPSSASAATSTRGRGAPLRVRLRGSHGRGVGARRGARRAHRRHRLDPVRARAEPRSRALDGDGRGSRGARRRAASRSCRPRRARRLPAALVHLERELFTDDVDDRAAARRLDPLPRGSRNTRHGRARRERGRGARCGAARRRRASPSSASPSTAGERRSRRRFAQLGVPCARRARTPSGRVAAGRRAPVSSCGTSGSAAVAAICSRSSVRRSPGSSVARSTSSRDASAGVRSPTRRASRRRARSCAALRCPRSSSCGRPRIRSWARRLFSRSMVRNAWGLESPPTSDDARVDARAYRAAERTLGELAALAGADSRSCREDVLAALERTRVAPESPAQGRVAVARPRASAARARSTSCSCSASRKGRSRAAADRRRFSSDELRAELGGRLARPDAVARDRYLFYTTCTRATRRLVLVREAAGDEGVPREPSPFWEDVRSLFDDADVQRATRRRSLSALTWPLESAPSERERLRALVRLAAEDEDGADASPRPTTGRAGSTVRGERSTGRPRCGAGRSIAPVRREDDLLGDGARAVRGLLVGVARRARHRSEEDRRRARPDPARLGAAHDAESLLRVAAARARLRARDTGEPRGGDRARPSLPRRCARVRRAARSHRAPGGRAPAHAPLRPRGLPARRGGLGRGVRARDGSRSRSAPTARPRSSSAASRSPTISGSPGRSTGSTSTRSARAGSCRTTSRGRARTPHARSTVSSACRSRSTSSRSATSSVSSRSAACTGRSRGAGSRAGCSRESAREDLPGFARDDYLDEDTFWARSRPRASAPPRTRGASRAGDVRHDPKGDGCPSWCDLWPICRVPRA